MRLPKLLIIHLLRPTYIYLQIDLIVYFGFGNLCNTATIIEKRRKFNRFESAIFGVFAYNNKKYKSYLRACAA